MEDFVFCHRCSIVPGDLGSNEWTAGLPGMLDAAERFVVERTAVGEPAVFPHASAAKPRIRATVIRHLLLGEAVPGARETASVQWPEVRVHARYDRRASRSRRLCPSWCRTADARAGELRHKRTINLATARLARLSLAHSRFTLSQTCARRRSTVRSTFLTRMASTRKTAGSTHVAPCSAASLSATRRNCAPRPNAASWRRATGTAHSGSPAPRSAAASGSPPTSRRSVACRSMAPRSTATSCSPMRSWFSGEDDAFRAGERDVDGVMRLHHFLAEGVVWLHGLRTGGVLEMQRCQDLRRPSDWAWLAARTARRTAGGRTIRREIGASMRLSPNLVADGWRPSRSRRFAGHVDARGAQADQPKRRRTARARCTPPTPRSAPASCSTTRPGRTARYRRRRIGGHLSLSGPRCAHQTRTVPGRRWKR